MMNPTVRLHYYSIHPDGYRVLSWIGYRDHSESFSELTVAGEKFINTKYTAPYQSPWSRHDYVEIWATAELAELII